MQAGKAKSGWRVYLDFVFVNECLSFGAPLRIEPKSNATPELASCVSQLCRTATMSGEVAHQVVDAPARRMAISGRDGADADLPYRCCQAPHLIQH